MQEETLNKIPSTSQQQPKTPQMNAKFMRMRESEKYSQIAKFGVCTLSDRNVANTSDDIDEENMGTTVASRTGNKQDPLSFNVNKVKSMI